jgi:hypothetical protein
MNISSDRKGAKLLIKKHEMFLKDQQEMEEHKKTMQRECPHLDSRNNWAFNLVHNFPDSLPRGTCSQCMIFIEPRHQECGGPNELITVDEHPLYPVVRWMEWLDYTLAKLEQDYIKTVDAALGDSDRKNIITQAETDYIANQNIARIEFEVQTRRYLPISKEPGQ